MINKLDLDSTSPNLQLSFDDNEVDSCNIRVRPAEFARIIDCSKQAVSIWVKDGKITLGTDGRLNPSVAISQLLKNSNPNLLRAKALKPLIKVINVQKMRVEQLESEVKWLKEDVDFYEGASVELIECINKIEDQLLAEIEILSLYPTKIVVHSFLSWLSELTKKVSLDLDISDFLPVSNDAPLGIKEGGDAELNEPRK